mgnify:CR=1 FL=1
MSRRPAPTLAATARVRPLGVAGLLGLGACGVWLGDSAGTAARDSVLDSDEPSVGSLLSDLDLEISAEVPSVAKVRWTSPTEAVGSVRFGAAGELVSAAAVRVQGDRQEAYLLGLLPDEDYAFEVTVSMGDEVWSSAEQVFHTGAWVAPPPQVEVSLYDPESSAGGFTIVPLQGGDDCWTMVLDEQGRTVWAHPISCLTHRVRLAQDGSGFISHTRSSPQDPLVLEHISFFGEPIASIVVPDAHHDFAIVEHGTYAVLGYTERSFFDGEVEVRLVGDTILEVDTEGHSHVVWDLFDHLEPVLEGFRFRSDWSDGAWDWSHGNYLSYVAEEDAYYVSSRALNALFKVDRTTGAHLWTLADGFGDFGNAGDRPLLDTPHSVEPVDGGVLYFNQQAAGIGCSEAVVAQLDELVGTAERVWSYETSDCLKVDYLGNAWQLSNGNVLAVFSQRGQADEVTPAGDVVHRLSTDIGWWFSYAQRVDSLYVGMGQP